MLLPQTRSLEPGRLVCRYGCSAEQLSTAARRAEPPAAGGGELQGEFINRHYETAL